jgi:hypothetical protein
MADELDDFLRQAAQRRMQRQQEKNANQKPATAAVPQSRPQRANPPRPNPKPPKDLSGTRPAIFEDPSSIEDRSLEPSIAQRHVSTDIDLADEGMDSYVRATMGDASKLSHLQNRAKGKKSSTKTKTTNQSDQAPSVQQRPNDVVGSSELITQLRDPKTLRMAILAHEILKRPYQ